MTVTVAAVALGVRIAGGAVSVAAVDVAAVVEPVAAVRAGTERVPERAVESAPVLPPAPHPASANPSAASAAHAAERARRTRIPMV